jgi:wyosine [tRNA(Phe)-imidazoG37] synthetase (radical SAM superfamily)
VGRTTNKTIERRPYILGGRILDQLQHKLRDGVHADYITLGGSGEPTLNSQIASLIHDIKNFAEIPVAVLTNGSLLGDAQVRESLMEADVVLPSLDAHDQTGFEAVNGPHPGISFETMVKGLIAFRKEFPGEIWLEVFVLEGFNASEADGVEFKHWIDEVNPQKVHINTAVRPTAEAYARRVSPQGMARLCRILGEKAEVIAPYKDLERHEGRGDIEQDLVNLLTRRPCSLNDISSGLNVHRDEIQKYVDPLVKSHAIDRVKKGSVVYYRYGLGRLEREETK